MGVVADFCMYDVVVKSSRSLSHLLVSSCLDVQTDRQTDTLIAKRRTSTGGEVKISEIFRGRGARRSVCATAPAVIDGSKPAIR